jgi:hypothetical protein
MIYIYEFERFLQKLNTYKILKKITFKKIKKNQR